jgi:thioesterase domain-containing protein
MDDGTQHKPFVAQDGGKGPLFVVQSVGDECYLGDAVSRCLDRHVETYELPVRNGYRTVEGLASHMIRVMHSVRPVGPYRVAGCGLSGLLAYEIATQLLGDDEEVEFLALITGRHRSVSSVSRGNGSSVSCESSQCGDDKDRLGDGVLKTSQTINGPHEPRSKSESEHPVRRRSGLDRDAVGSYSAHPLPIPIHVFLTEAVKAIREHFDWEQIIPLELRRVIFVSDASEVLVDDRSPQCLGRAFSVEIDRASKCRREPSRADHNFLFTIQTGDPNEVPIVCVPGAGDNVASFLDLAAKLGDRQPVYSIQPRGYFANQIPHSTVRAASKAYIRELEEHLHSNSVDLVGHSYGGWIAFEMSLQLSRGHKKVRSLSLLDSKPPCEDNGGIQELSRTDVLMKMVAAFQMSMKSDIDLCRGTFEGLDQSQQLRILHGELVKKKIYPIRSNASVLVGPFRAFAAALRSAYVPSSAYEGETRLFIAANRKTSESETARSWSGIRDGWIRWAPRLRVLNAPGNHVTMLKSPQVNVIASLLRPRVVTDVHCGI